MSRLPTRSRSRAAVAAVEFAVLLPLILTLLVGLWEIGRLVEVQQQLTNAAREGGRQASTGQFTNAQVKNIVIQYLNVAGLPTTNVQVTVTNLTHPGIDVSQASYLDRIQINVSIPYNDIRWSVISSVTGPTSTLTAQVTWVTMVDKPYPNPVDPPVG